MKYGSNKLLDRNWDIFFVKFLLNQSLYKKLTDCLGRLRSILLPYNELFPKDIQDMYSLRHDWNERMGNETSDRTQTHLVSDRDR